MPSHLDHLHGGAAAGLPGPCCLNSNVYMPRKIILVRHGESEGNADWRKLATIPDHLLQLTPQGRAEAFEAGTKLRGMVESGDRVRFYVSPYTRTRQTLEEILKSFGGPGGAGNRDGRDDREPTTNEQVCEEEPDHDEDDEFFQGESEDMVIPEGGDGEVEYDVREEPRLREQDWGNFQNFEQMQVIKAERIAYGTFYYRIPNGESGADVHDRVSLFLESFRSTQSKSYPCHPTVVVIVTHGLLARLFVMRFMRLTVNEYEKWRNPRNGEVYCLEMMSERERIAEGKKRGGRQVHSYKMTIPPQYRDDENKKRDEERKSLAKKLSLRRQKTLDLSIAQMAKELEELGVGDLASVGVDGDPDGV